MSNYSRPCRICLRNRMMRKVVIKKTRGFLVAQRMGCRRYLPAEGWKSGERVRTGWMSEKGCGPLSEIRVCWRGGERLIDTSNCLINCSGKGLCGIRIFDLVTLYIMLYTDNECTLFSNTLFYPLLYQIIINYIICKNCCYLPILLRIFVYTLVFYLCPTRTTFAKKYYKNNNRKLLLSTLLSIFHLNLLLQL